MNKFRTIYDMLDDICMTYGLSMERTYDSRLNDQVEYVFTNDKGFKKGYTIKVTTDNADTLKGMAKVIADDLVSNLKEHNHKVSLAKSGIDIYKAFAIERVIFNKPATIVFWKDGTKTIVKCGELDIYDPEKGLAMAISKKALGNQGSYFEVFKRFVPAEEAEMEGE